MSSHDRTAARDAPLNLDDIIRERSAELVASFAWVRLHGLDPEDIAQEALLIVSAKFEDREFANAGYVMNYCRVIGRNLAWALLDPRGYARNETPSDDPAKHEHAALAPDAAAIAVQNADLARVFAALPASYQQVLVLAGDGFNSAMIAESLGLPSSEAARQLLVRARRAAQRGLSAGEPSVVVFAAWRFLQRVTSADAERAATSTAPAINAASGVAAAIAFSLVTVVAGLPPDGAAPQNRPRRTSAAPLPPRGSSARRPGPSSMEVVPVVGARPTPADPVGSRRARRVLASSVSLPTCTRGICVETTPTAPPRPGDTIRVKPLDMHVTQWVVPVCEYVVSNPVVDCTRQEPDEWVVQPPPGRR